MSEDPGTLSEVRVPTSDDLKAERKQTIINEVNDCLRNVALDARRYAAALDNWNAATKSMTDDLLIHAQLRRTAESAYHNTCSKLVEAYQKLAQEEEE